MAYFYLFGIGVDKDEKRAFELYQQAAKQNCAPALKSLAFMYMQGLGTKPDVPKAFASLQQAYQILPNDNLWHAIERMANEKNYRIYPLKITVDYHKIIYRKKFSYEDSSDEDYIAERLKFFKRTYQLNFTDAIGSLYNWPRPTWSIVLGETIGEITPLKERYLTKMAIQGDYAIMRFLSYYYKGEVKNIEQAQLWRKYAITMGELPSEHYWPNYPPLSNIK
ncbi:sel1 repeat family protein [Gilliamella sp. B2717]|nr:sel1 repeat family protein [Gilliamella sp. B2717]